MIDGLRQEYGKYTSEDQFVWKKLFDRQMEQLDRVADTAYLKGVKEIGFNNSQIPNLKEVNTRLAKTTGWEIVVVPGIIEEKEFFSLLANKQFPSSTWLRPINQLDYLSEPDMFHDAFGHIPLLTNQTFCDFYESIGRLGVKHLNDAEIITALGRIYWFTVEFGLINTQGNLKIYGAGILSSIGETKYSLSNYPTRKPFNLEEVINTDFDNTKIQDLYFVIDSFDQLLVAFRELEQKLLNRVQKAK